MHAGARASSAGLCSVAQLGSSPVVYFMAQEAHQAPVGRSRSSSSSSTSPATTGMWDSPRQMQAHTPFPSWIPSYAGTFAAGAAPSLPSEHGPDHAWNQSAPTMGAHGGSGYRGNFLSLLEAKNVTPEMFEDDDVPAAACDYLGVGGVGAAASNMAGPAAAAAYGLGSVDPYSTVASSAPRVKHETAISSPSPLVYSGGSHSVVHGSSIGCMPCYDREEKPSDDSQRQGFAAPSTAAFLQQMIPSRVELQSALGYSGMVSERLESSFGVGSLPDAGSFSDYNRSSTDFLSSNSNSQEQDIKPGMGSTRNGSGAATSAATRRKSEETVAGNTKKSKQEASHKQASPPKSQVPKVKLGEKITALQQIVSPFGKTDTSSVLFETIEYIKFLHEQIRSPDTDRRGKKLFSEPYMTKSTYKGHTHIRRRGEEKEEESGTGHHELRGRGLCLVPVSLTSQAYHDDTTLPDCWAPAYRGCLYP